MNTKGIKFLAVLAVLAMAFAAFAVIAPAEENDAVPAVADVTTVTNGKIESDAATANFYVADSGKVTVKVYENAANVANVYVMAGNSVEFVGATGNIGILNIYQATAAPVDGTIAADKIDNVNYVTVSAALATTDSITFTSAYTTKGNVSTVYGSVTPNVTVTGSIKVTDGESLTLTNASTIDAANYKAYFGNATTKTYYNTVTDEITVDAVTETFFIKDGSASIVDGENSIQTGAYKDNGFKSTDGLTITYDDGLVAKGTINKGSLTVVDGSLKVATGGENKLVTVNSSYAPTSVVTGTVEVMTYVAVGENGTTYGNTGAVTINASVSEASFHILGDYRLKSNEKIDFAISVEGASALTVPAKYTLTLGKNATVEANAFDVTVQNHGLMDVWGTVKGVSGKTALEAEVAPTLKGANGSVYLRDGSNITGVTVGDIGYLTELPATEILNYISGQASASTTLENVVLADAYTIPEGMTVTITDMLALDGKVLTVNGKLIVAEGAFIGQKYGMGATANVIIGSKGSIENNGTIGKNVALTVGTSDTSFVTLSGVTGVSVGYSASGVTVSGTLAPATGGLIANPNLALKGAFIVKEMTVPAELSLTVTAASTLKGKLNVDGVLTLTKTLNMDAGSELVMNGYMTGILTAKITTVGNDVISTAAPGSTVTITSAAGEGTLGTVAHTPCVYTGFTVSVVKTSYVQDDVQMYNQRAYISGDLTVTPAVKNDGVFDAPTLTIAAGAVFIAADDVFEQMTKEMFITLANDSGYLFVEGTLASASAFDHEDQIVGAVYEIGETAATKVYYAEGYADGLDAVAIAYNKAISLNYYNGYEFELAEDLTVNDKETISATCVSATDKGSIIIPEGLVVTVKNGATFAAESLKAIDGKLVVEKTGACTPDAELYDVMSETADGTITYCGLQIALADSAEGDTISIVTPAAKLTTLTIPTKRTIIVESGATLTVENSIVVSADSEMTINGTLNFGKESVKSTKITVNGILDVSAGTLVLTEPAEKAQYPMTIAAEGKFIYKAAQMAGYGTVVLNGVTYKDGTKTVLTSLANAAKDEATAISITGKYTSTEPVDIGAATLTIQDEAKVTISSLEIKGGTIQTDGTGVLTASIKGLAGEDEPVQVDVTGFKGTITDKLKSDKYTFAIADMTGGSLTVADGIATVTGNLTVAAENSFVVAADGGLYTDGTYTIANTGVMQIAGGLYVADEALTITDGVGDAGKLTISGFVTIDGTLNLQTAAKVTGSIAVDGTLVADENLTVLGTIAVDDSEGSTAIFTIMKALILGESAYAAADGAVLMGVGTLNDGNAYIVAYAGSTVDPATIEKGTLKSTEFSLNGAPYLTAYAIALNNVKLVNEAGGVIDHAVKIGGYNMAGMTTDTNWLDELGGKVVADSKIGSYEKIFYTGISYNAKVLLSSITGVSVFVDGVRYDSGTTINNVKVGTHTLSVTINPGYKGTTAATFAGKSVTSSFEVTSDMTGADPAAVVLSVTGDITIDPGVSPEPTPAEKEAFGITEILLVVLVILIAVMVIIVLLRMNRS